MQEFIKKNAIHFGAVILFFILSITYFSPTFLDGKVLRQADNEKFAGMAQELISLQGTTNEIIAWQGNMFSGMPSYHTTVIGVPPNALSYVGTILSFIDYHSARIVFLSLLCFYILMCVLKVNRWLAIGGAIAYAFASYNIIILVAGHITKGYVMAYMPLTIAGLFLIFRNNRFWGSILFLLGVAFSVKENHLQITYYLLLFCAILYIGYIYTCIKEQKIRDLVKNTGLLIGCTILAILPSLSNLYSNLELSKTSTRGATELTITSENDQKISTGLDKDYAFQWSYGKGELLTLLIPNVYGGSTVGTLGSDSELYKTLRSHGAQVGREVQTYTYWGDKPGTSGPVYMGAIVCFLFIFGMFVIRSKFKWWLLGAAIFLTFLALGRNFDAFNDFMFHYLPMYNKFRTVEMALVIPGLILPFIAFWGMNEVIKKNVDEKLFKKGLYTALGSTGIICLIIWIAPTAFLSFQSNYDTYYQLPDWYYNALLIDRASLASDDALRSLVFILLTAALLFWLSKTNRREQVGTIVSICLGILVLVDLWSVDKRYLNNDNFIHEKPQELYKPSIADNIILEDKDVSFRVLNLNNPFQETTTAYFHKSIGGYHAVKLGRYQELIDLRLHSEMNMIIQALQTATTTQDLIPIFAQCYSLNMLNTRYIIYSPDQPPLQNPFAYGNAWFVDKVEVVENADEEIVALNTINPLEEAVVDKRFAAELMNFNSSLDSTATITLNSYAPNRLIYTTQTATEQLAVFSEIYYQPGWKVTIDGTPVSHLRADWTLRAMRVPAGEHEIIFEFHPDGYITASYMESYSSFLILFLVIGAIIYTLWKKYQKSKLTEADHQTENE